MRVEPPTSTTSSICSRLQAGVFQRLLAGSDGAIDDRLDQLLELLARNLALIALATGQFNVQLGRGLRRQRDLGLDDRFADGGHDFAVARDIEFHVAANVVERDA